MTEVLFAPDWRSGVPYQRLLAEALAAHEVRVSFLQGYKRALPLTRLLQDWRKAHPCDLLHLHWPEAYFARMGDRWDAFRRARFSLDLALATRTLPLVVTAHNLHAHNRAEEPFIMRNSRAAFRRAAAVIAHSAAAGAGIAEQFGVAPERIHVIPHGDLSVTMPPPIPRAEARAKLELGSGPLCLVFGALEPYKGVEEIIAFWRDVQPGVQLAIAGKPMSPEYGAELEQLARGVPDVTLRFGWLADADLAIWLSAVDAVLFNYRTIFTSGAASLARSWGVPLLLPRRLRTVDLAEPSKFVLRFESPGSDLREKLREALAIVP
jgi:glycosyltransferase involved in cell wall biosynthesis